MSQHIGTIKAPAPVPPECIEPNEDINVYASSDGVELFAMPVNLTMDQALALADHLRNACQVVTRLREAADAGGEVRL